MIALFSCLFEPLVSFESNLRSPLYTDKGNGDLRLELQTCATDGQACVCDHQQNNVSHIH